MIRRLIVLLIALALVVAACGGDDATTTEAPGDSSSEPPPTQSSPPPFTGTAPPAETGSTAPMDPPAINTGDFCADADANEALIDGVNFFADDLEADVERWLGAIAAAEAAAPLEIADDVAVIANAARGFVEVLEEAGFEPSQIDPSDPRLAALEDGSLDEAAANIDEFCGFDIDGAGSGDSDSDTGGSLEFGNDPLPDDLAEDLVVPELIGVQDNGAAGLNLGTSLAFDDTVSFYEDAFGVAATTSGAEATINAPYGGATWLVFIQAIEDDLTLVTLLRL